LKIQKVYTNVENQEIVILENNKSRVEGM